MTTPQITRHLPEAARAIDAQFGEGYAREHPDLVASLVQSATIEAAVATGYGAHQEALAAARQISAELGDTLLKLKPQFFG
ncbi:hypothetical protein SAMN04487859_11314 [Roseovarius lutimaris]|uniref:Uncharacterized protein n=1 Tax=Roseovarius lutimaris TaxID=1005928 RepID=A0A1I5DN76_9RHOB|nr:hypothetical protein [Roseovarius lutimaris]SFO00607.1 hypothetical protein SAMN04487859_11314 [Roseovarius lutimaris]